MGRLRGGLSSKLRALVADGRTALIIGLRLGRHGDVPTGLKLLCRVVPASGQPALIIDRAYDDDQIRQPVRELGYRPVVPPPNGRNPS